MKLVFALWSHCQIYQTLILAVWPAKSKTCLWGAWILCLQERASLAAQPRQEGPGAPPHVPCHSQRTVKDSTRQRKSEVLGVCLQHSREFNLLFFLSKYFTAKSKLCSCYFLLLIFLGLACLSPVSIKDHPIHSYQWCSWGGFYRWNRGAGFARNAALKSSEYFGAKHHLLT